MMASDGSLKLRAHDPRDMRVISAVLQDALVPLKEIAYLKREHRFVMVANRFRWEDEPKVVAAAASALAQASGQDARFADAEEEGALPGFERINCGLVFDRVRQVRYRGFDLAKRGQILNLLTLEQDATGVTLVFSDQASIRLEGRGVACHLEDLGEPWPTDARPDHNSPDDAPDDSPAGT